MTTGSTVSGHQVQGWPPQGPRQPALEIGPSRLEPPQPGWRLTIYPGRQWLLRPAQQHLRQLLDGQHGEVHLTLTLQLEARDLIPELPGTPASSLDLLARRLVLDPTHGGSQLQVACLVRAHPVGPGHLRCQLLSGSIVLAGLERRPHILEPTHDALLDIWPTAASLLAIHLGRDRFQLSIQGEAVGMRDRHRLDFLRPLAEGRVLWREAECAEDPRAKSPRAYLEALTAELQAVVAGSPLRIEQAAVAGERAIYRITGIKRRTSLLQAADAGSMTLSAPIPIPNGSRVLLEPLTSRQEWTRVRSSAPMADDFVWHLDAATRIDHDAGVELQVPPQPSEHRYLSPGLTLYLDSVAGAPSRWTPTVLVLLSDGGEQRWRFLDLDPALVDAAADLGVLLGARPQGIRARLTSASSRRFTAEVLDMPPLRLSGVDGEAANRVATNGYLWQQAPIRIEGESRDRPPVWVRHHLADLAGQDLRADFPEGFTRISAPVRVTWTPSGSNTAWELALDPRESEDGRVDLELTLVEQSGSLSAVLLGVDQAHVALSSPPLPLLATDVHPLPQPDSPPGLLRLDEDALVRGRLRFENLPARSPRAGGLASDAVEDNRLRFVSPRDGDALTIYVDGPRAVIDPASPARANLVLGVEQGSGRLQRARDPSHGQRAAHVEGSLTMEQVEQFGPPLDLVRVVLPAAPRPELPEVGQLSPLGVLALNPWIEVAVDARGDQHARALHRNGVLEHAAYDAAGRFLAPARSDDRPPVRLAAQAFRAAVRDIAADATRFVALDSRGNAGALPLQSWLPHAELVDAGGNAITGPTLRFIGGELPALLLSDGVNATEQRLDLEAAGDPGFRWLDLGVAWEPTANPEPRLRLTEEPTAEGVRARDSAVDLLFEPAATGCLAASADWIAAARDHEIQLRRRSAQPLALKLESTVEPIRQLSIADAGPDGPLVVVAADRAGHVLCWQLDVSGATTQHWRSASSLLGSNPRMGGNQVLALDDGARLLAGGGDALLRILDTSSRSVRTVIDTEGAAIVSIGAAVLGAAPLSGVSVHADGHVRVWDLSTGGLSSDALNFGVAVQDAALAPRDARLYAISGDEVLCADPLGTTVDQRLQLAPGERLLAVSAIDAKRPRRVASPVDTTWVLARGEVGAPYLLEHPAGTGDLGTPTTPCVTLPPATAIAFAASPGLALAWIATPRGDVAAWDPGRCRPFDRWSLPRRASYDTLGAIEGPAPTASPSAHQQALVRTARLPIGDPPVYQQVRLISGELTLDGGTPLHRTEIRFRCDRLAVRAADGVVLSPGSGWLPAVCGLFSSTHDEAPARRWARLCGVPIWLVDVERCLLEESALVGLVVRGVILSLAACGNEDGTDAIPPTVADSIARKAEVRVRVQRMPAGNLEIEVLEGHVDWHLPRLAASPFPRRAFHAHLARLTGSVSKDGDRLVVEPDRAWINTLERLWPVESDLPRIVGYGHASGFGFQSDLAADPDPIEGFAEQPKLSRLLRGENRLLLLVKLSDRLELHDLVTGIPLWTLNDPVMVGKVTAMALAESASGAADAATVLLGGDGGELWLVELPTERPLQLLATLNGRVQDLSLGRAACDPGSSPRVAFAAAGDALHALVELDPGRFQVLLQISGTEIEGLSPVCAGNQEAILTSWSDGKVRLVDAASGDNTLIPSTVSDSIALDGHEDEGLALIGGAGGRIEVWDLDASPPALVRSLTRSSPLVGAWLVGLDGAAAVLDVAEDGAWQVTPLGERPPFGRAGIRDAKQMALVAKGASGLGMVNAPSCLLTIDDSGAHRLWFVQAGIAIGCEGADGRHIAAQIPVPLPTGAGAPKLRARLAAGNGLSLDLQLGNDLSTGLAVLRESGMYAFLIEPLDIDWRAGRRLLLLWPEGSRRELWLAGMLLEDLVGPRAWRISGLPAGAQDIAGSGLRLQGSLAPVAGAVAPKAAWIDAEIDAFRVRTTAVGQDIQCLFAGQSSVAGPTDANGRERSLTALLMLSLPDTPVTRLQLPVRFIAHEQADGTRVLRLEPWIYAVRQVPAADPNSDTEAGTIAFPGPGQAFQVRALGDRGSLLSSTHGLLLVQVSIGAGRLRLGVLEPSEYALSPCMDTHGGAGVPQLPRQLPRLLHRRAQGVLLRPDLDAASLTGQPDPSGLAPWNPPPGDFVLHPLDETDDGVQVMQSETWLEPLATPVEPAQSETLLALRRPMAAGGGHRLQIHALESVSAPRPGSSKRLLDPERLGRILNRAGVGGLLVHRVVRDLASAVHTELRPIRTDAATGGAAVAPDALSSPRGLATVIAPSRPVNVQVLTPAVAAAWDVTTAVSLDLQPNPLQQTAPEPLPDACQMPGESSWERQLSLVLTGHGEVGTDPAPVLRVLEQSARAQAAAVPLAESAASVSDRPSTDPEDGFTSYLPASLSMVHAFERPGGVAHHSLVAYQPKRAALDAALRQLGTTSRVSLRERQRFTPPRGAAIDLPREPTLTATTVADLPDTFDIDVAWRETFEQLNTDCLALSRSIAVQCNDDGSGVLACVFSTDGENRQAFALISLVNERLIATSRDSLNLPLATTSAPSPGEPPPLFLLTRIDEIDGPLQATVTGSGAMASYRLMLEILTRDNSRATFQLDDIFEHRASVGGLHLWGLQATAGTLPWNALATLGFYWQGPGGETDRLGRDLFLVRQVPPSPLGPRLSLVLTASGASPSYERVLLFGEAAPAANAALRMEANGGGPVLLKYQSDDKEIVSVALDRGVSQHSSLKVHLVKTNGDGSVMTARSAVVR